MTPPGSDPRARAAGRFERLVGLAAAAFPAGIALSRVSEAPAWAGDVGAVRNLALAGVGWGGGVSTPVTQLASLLPIGSLSFRAALVSVVALGVVARGLFTVALHALRTVERSAGLAASWFAAPALAAIGTLLATMSPTLQREATSGGTSMLAVALATAAMTRAIGVASGETESRSKTLSWVGVLVGALVGECPLAAAATAAACVGVLVAWPRLEGSVVVPTRAFRMAGWLGFATMVVSLLPAITRALAPVSFVDLGGSIASLPEVRLAPLFAAWSEEVGWVALAMATVGGVALVGSRGARGLAAGLAAWVGLDWIAHPFVGATMGGLAVRLLAFGWISCATAVGVFWILGWLARARVPFARAGAALVVAFQATTVALVVELAADVSDRARQTGATLFTDLALERLPARAAIIVDDPVVAWRLLAAQLVEGRRRDVLVVPRDFLGKPTVAGPLLVRESKVEPLLLAVALGGSADEYALSEMAAARPLFVEPERGWSEAVFAHVSLTSTWLRFAPEPQGPVERRGDVERTLSTIEPLLRAAAEPGVDPATAVVAAGCARSQAKTLLRMGDSKGASVYLRAIDTPSATAVRASKSLEVQFAAAVARLPVNEPKKPVERPRPEPPRARARQPSKPKR